MLQNFNTWFWNPNFWLPPNVTWTEVLENKNLNFPKAKDLLYPIPLAVLLLIVRYFLERRCYAPLGRYLGIKHKVARPLKPYVELERIFRRNKKPSQIEIEQGAALVSLSEREVARWFRIRRSNEKPSKLTKFCECSYRLSFYICSVALGFYVLWDKEWLWDIQTCWKSYPYQSVDDGIWWYYIVYLSYSLAWTISHFFDVKHKDFWQMFVHHITGLCLIGLSWIANITRLGSLVIIVHDPVDILLEASKIFNYAKFQRVCDGLFIGFTILWFLTRIGMYPFWILRSSIKDSPVPSFPVYTILNIFLVLLSVLHLMWTYQILRVVKNTILKGKMEGDVRSSSDEYESDDCQKLSADGSKKKKN